MTTTIHITDPIIIENILSGWNDITQSGISKLDTTAIINAALQIHSAEFSEIFKRHWHEVVNVNSGLRLGYIKYPGRYVTGATEAAIDSYISGAYLVFYNPSETSYFWIWGNMPVGMITPEFTSEKKEMKVGARDRHSGHITMRWTVSRYDGYPRMVEIMARTKLDIIGRVKITIKDLIRTALRELIRNEIIARVK